MKAQVILMYIAVASLCTVLIRALPFLVFRSGRKVPEFIEWTGRNLPRACMAMLVVYCLKDISFSQPASFVPALAASVVTVVLHAAMRKMILSICGGTAVYMLLLRLL